MRQATGLSHEEHIKVLSQLPEVVLDLLSKFPGRLYLVGGFITSAVIGETPKDIDMCCSWAIMPSVSKAMDNEGRLSHGRNSEKSITYKIDDGPLQQPEVQLLTCRDFKSPIDALKFDYKHCQVALWDAADSTIIGTFCSLDWHRVVKERQLELGDVTDDPIHTIDRARKFLQRGWTMSSEEFAKVLAGAVTAIGQEGLTVDQVEQRLVEAQS